MARHLPAVLPGGNGGKPAPSRRDGRGRFVAGSAPGPGRPANPFARYQAELRAALLAEVRPADVQAILRQIIRLAKRGSLQAAELLLRWTMGAPLPAVDPDFIAAHELSVKRAQPTLIDELALAPAQNADDRQPAADAEAEGEAEDADPLQPSLRQTLSWCVQELAQAQYALRMQRPPSPDPAAGWERFAASRLEFAPEAAAPMDLLHVAYAKWCGAHGEPVLAEEQLVAALQARGASLRTAPLSQCTTVVGVRVVA